MSKFNYAAFKSSGAQTQVRDFMTSNLDVAKNNILSSSGQAISWDESGFHLRKLLEDGTGYADNQIRMSNNSIVFTDDGWDTAKMAIGQFADSNTGTTWGIVAPSIVGTLIAGENLVIENQKVNPDGTLGAMQFKVDASGAYLNNSTFLLQADNGGKMLFDPMYGLAAGTGDLYSTDGTQVTPSFIDEDGNIVFDDAGMPQNSNLYFDLNTGDVYFRGTIYADSGYFAGDIQANRYLDASGTDMFVDGQFQSDYLNLKGLNINDNFIIDEDGNVTINGGSISWGAVSGTDELDDRLDDIESSIPSLPSYLKSTYIDGTSVSAPIIRGGTVSGAKFANLDRTTWIEVGKDYYGVNNDSFGLAIFNEDYGDEAIFAIYSGDAGITGYYGKGSSRFLSHDGEYNITSPQGTWDFSGATVIDLHATFA